MPGVRCRTCRECGAGRAGSAVQDVPGVRCRAFVRCWSQQGAVGRAGLGGGGEWDGDGRERWGCGGGNVDEARRGAGVVCEVLFGNVEYIASLLCDKFLLSPQLMRS